MHLLTLLLLRILFTNEVISIAQLKFTYCCTYYYSMFLMFSKCSNKVRTQFCDITVFMTENLLTFSQNSNQLRQFHTERTRIIFYAVRLNENITLLNYRCNLRFIFYIFS